MTDEQLSLPPRPKPSWWAIVLGIATIVFTIVCARRVGFSFSGIVEDLQRPNPVADGLRNVRWGEMFSDRSRSAFIETLQLA
ncbi:MAG TPA: hypothetical protein VMM60_16195, partial [Ilumatobacter sp.]|nr:hypothetical protein [Ilumatobacter sp.]